MKITKLEFQKRNQELVNLFLDGKFALSISADKVVQMGLKPNQQISEPEFKKILDESEFGKLFTAVLRFLAFRQRSESEIRVYLARKIKSEKLQNDLTEQVISKLKSLKMIDDLAFAQWIIESRHGFRPKGKYAIIQELRRKGIDKEMVDELLVNSKNDGPSEISLAKRALEKFVSIKVKTIGLSGLGKLKAKNKMQRYLLSKGFDWDVSRQAVSRLP